MGGDQLVVKRIVVLANSYKHDGRCVAGREVAVAEDGRVTFGGWLRPVNDTEDGELLPEQCRLQDGSLPRPLDIIDIPCSGPQGDPTQPENWLLAGGTNWRRAGRLSPDHLPELAERPAQLWPDDSSYTDRVAATAIAADPPEQSLYLLQFPRCTVVKAQSHGYRLRFAYRGRRYGLKITDPAFEPRYHHRLLGHDELPLENIFACVSLGRPFNDDHYKLVATVMPPMLDVPLFTVGHSNLETDALISLLRYHRVDAVADVRSRPYSARYPHFGREALRGALEAAGIAYVFLGAELGARRDEPECYVEGQARYERIAACPAFRRGLGRVLKGAVSYRIALLCAEQDPLTCHRAILVCRHLWPLGFEIQHILSDGRLETQPEAERRLMEEEKLNPDQPPLFNLSETTDGANPLERAYVARGARIAYRMDERDDDDLYDRLHAEER